MNADRNAIPPEHKLLRLAWSTTTLDGLDKVIEGLDGLGNGGEALVLGLEASLEVDVLDGLEEGVGLLLLGGGGGAGTDGTTGLVHVSGELVTYVEPLLALGVPGELLEADAGLGKDGLPAVGRLVAFLVEGVRTGLAVDGVRRVDLGGLVGAVGGTLGIGGTVTDEAEDGELGRLTRGGVGDGGDDGSTSGGDAGKGVTTAGLLLFPAWHGMEIERAVGKRAKLDHKFVCLHIYGRVCVHVSSKVMGAGPGGE